MERNSLKCNVDLNPKLRKEIEVIDVLLALVLVSLYIISLFSYSFYRQEISDSVILYGNLGLFFSVAFLEFVPQILSPYLSLIVSIPYLGVSNAIIMSIFGSLVGCFLGFEIGRKYGWRLICPFFEEKTLGKILRLWGKYGKWFVFIAALSPLPDVPLIYGALGMKRKDFLIFGILTKVISFIIVGYAFYYGFL